MGRFHDEGGFTIVETLVALAMFVVVLGGVLTALEFSGNGVNKESERDNALSEVTVGVSRMLNDLRSAYKVNAPIGSSTSSYIDVDVHIPGSSADKRIFYNCAYSEPGTAYKECVRYLSSTVSGAGFTAGTAPSGVTPQVIVPRVMNETSSDPSDPVFKGLATPTGSGSQPTFGEVTIHTPGKGGYSAKSYGNQVVISDSFYLRNLDIAR
jgi:type II secretory pathway pseudopilin PulG